SAGSQFFIVHQDSTFLDNNYTVFGKVTSGMDVVDTIVALPKNASDMPSERVEMTVTVVD
ncbi:peptidylprolyl isomerase, partial [Myxococcota bacterium]|nr:peptidylprolyl isomerase [Myxococcota bacterium]